MPARSTVSFLMLPGVSLRSAGRVISLVRVPLSVLMTNFRVAPDRSAGARAHQTFSSDSVAMLTVLPVAFSAIVASARLKNQRPTIGVLEVMLTALTVAPLSAAFVKTRCR